MKKKKSLVPAPVLLCLTAAVGVGMLFPASAADIGKRHVKTSEKIYAAQDAAAAKCKVLESEKKYAEAIRLLKEEVIEPLELEIAEVDSWKARQRLAEFKKELVRLQLILGNIKLNEAEVAMIKGLYNEAIASANEASQIAPQLRDKAMALSTAANGRKNAAAREDKTSADKNVPELMEKDRNIKRLLAEARTLYRNARYEEAIKRIEEVYAINPFNADAAYLATQIYKKFYQIGNYRRRADIASQMSYEAWQWVEPAFPIAASPSENSAGGSGKGGIKESDSAIQKRLDSIIFKSVSFNQTDMEGVIEALNDNKIHDPEEIGVVIDFIRTAAEKPKAEGNAEAAPDKAAAPPADGAPAEENSEEDSGEEEEEEGKAKDNEVYVTLELKNVSLRQLLDYVCFLTDYTYVIRNDRVVFGAPDQQMDQAQYELKNSLKALIVGKPAAAEAPAPEEGGEEEGEEGGEEEEGKEGGEEGEEGGEEKAAPAPAAPVIKDEELTPALLQKFFSEYGIEFPKGSAISFYRGKLLMTNTKQNQLKLSALLDRINVDTDMIEVEVKSIEIAESDMEELGFNWAFGKVMKSSDGRSYGGNYRLGSYWQGVAGSQTQYDSESASLKMLDTLLSGVDSRILKDFNIFPDLLGSFKPFGIDESFNLTLTINALDRSDRTEQISAPKVLVNNNKKAIVEMTKSYYFPEEWEELEIEMEEVGDNGAIQLTITEPSPTFSETSEKIGTKFSVTPTIMDSKTIKLDLHPDITAWTGKDEYDIVARVRWTSGGQEFTKDFRWVVWRPIIAKRKLDITVNVNHGETLVIGGLSDSKSQKRLDKIPILADIPFIGRLFQSQSETSTRNNMLIFVTARFVDNSGVPRPLDTSVGNGGIPNMMR